MRPSEIRRKIIGEVGDKGVRRAYIAGAGHHASA